MLEYDTENLNSDEIYSSLRGVTEAIQSFRYRSEEDLNEPIRREFKKDDGVGVVRTAECDKFMCYRSVVCQNLKWFRNYEHEWKLRHCPTTGTIYILTVECSLMFLQGVTFK